MKKFLSKNYSLNTIFILCILVFLAFSLRAYLIPTNLFFGYEQGRDLLVVKDMVINHKLTLIGPKTDIEGVFHGPLFYYIAAIPFALSGGNPLVISLFFIFLNSVTIVPLYFLGKILANRRVGIIAATLYAFSFGAIVYARWLSNPPLSMLFVCLYFLFLLLAIQGRKYALIISAIFLGFLGQIEFINFLFFGVITGGLLILFRKKLLQHNLKEIFPAIGLFFVTAFGTYFLFDIRHEFLMTKGAISLLRGESGFYTSYLSSLSTAVVRLSSFVSYFVFPSSIVLALGVLLTSIVVAVKTQRRDLVMLLLVWLFSPALLLVLLRHDALEHLFVGVVPAIIILIALFLEFVMKKNKIIGIFVLFIIVGANMHYFFINISTNKNIFFQTLQPDFKYTYYKETIDKVYATAEGKKFIFQPFTIPYWSPQAWEYLFWYQNAQATRQVPSDKSEKLLYVLLQENVNNKDVVLQHAIMEGRDKEGYRIRNTYRIGPLTLQKMEQESTK